MHSLWAVFDHAIDTAGKSHQIRHGAWRVKWNDLFISLATHLLEGEAIGAMLVPPGWLGMSPTDYSIDNTRVLSGEAHSLVYAATSRANQGTLAQIFARMGVEPDEIPDVVFWPAPVSLEQIQKWSKAVLKMWLENDFQIEVPYKDFFDTVDDERIPLDVSVCLLHHGHLFILTQAKQDPMPLALSAASGEFGIALPKGFPPVEEDDQFLFQLLN